MATLVITVLQAGERNPVLRLRQGYGACTLLGTGVFILLIRFITQSTIFHSF
jgi:hypothetical protein